MALSFSDHLLNRLIAPGISEFVHCDAPEIAMRHPQADHWLVNHFLNSAFRAGFTGKTRQYALNLIFRAQVVLHDYGEGRKLTLEFFQKSISGSPATRLYFRAVSRWESCFLSLQIFIDLMNRMQRDAGESDVFKDGDETPEERAYRIANAVKHWGSDIQAERHLEADTIPLWLTNAGFQTRQHQLAYCELAKLACEVAEIADALQDPRSFVEAK